MIYYKYKNLLRLVVYMLNYKRNFSSVLKNLRQEKGYSQKKLSELSSVPYSSIQKYEQGTLTPTDENLIKLSNTLGVDYQIFLSDISVDTKKAILELFNNDYNPKNQIDFINYILKYFNIDVKFNNDESINIGNAKGYYPGIEVKNLNDDIKNLIIDKLILGVLSIHFINAEEHMTILEKLYVQKIKK